MKAKVTQEKLHQLLHYDPATGVFTWIAGKRRGKRAGGQAKYGYRRIIIDGREYLEHRLAWLFMKGWIPAQVDHKNRKRADNRWKNLRPATHAEQMRNQPVQKNNKLGVKGVTIEGGKYRVRISVDNKKLCLGRYDTLEEAAAVYRAGAIQHHGEFACF